MTDAILFMAAQGCIVVSLWHHATLPYVQHAKIICMVAAPGERTVLPQTGSNAHGRGAIA